MYRRIWFRTAALVVLGVITGCNNPTVPDGPKPVEDKAGKPVKPKVPRVPKS
jgi:hypothetical protein